jgi:hypothetical protein
MKQVKLQNSNVERKFLTVEDLARESGESSAVWRKRLYLRQLPHLKFGRNVRVARQDFDAFCAARVVPAGRRGERDC